jgi:hypothetical protein
MFDAIRAQYHTYANELPINIPQAVFKSAVISFAIATLISGNIDKGLVSAAFAATISLISGLTLPMFRRFCANPQGNISWFYHSVSIFVNMGITQIFMSALTAYRINLIASALFTVGLNLLLNGFADYKTSICPSYLVV